MARVPIHTRESNDDPALQPVFDGVDALGLQKFAHQLGALANHPALANAILGVLRAYYQDSTVPRHFLELAILLVSVHNRCAYCVVHHAPPARAAGVSAEQVQAIETGTWEEGDLFDAAERAVLRYTDQLSTRGGRIADSAFAELRRHFDERQVVELTVRAGMCEFFNRFNEAMQLEIEPVAEAVYRTTLRPTGARVGHAEPGPAPHLAPPER